MVKDNTATSYDMMELSHQTLCLTMCYNRRRAGESVNVKLEATESIMSGEGCVNQEIFESLTDFEKELIQHFLRFKTRGKRGRNLTALMRESIDVIANLTNWHLLGIYI